MAIFGIYVRFLGQYFFPIKLSAFSRCIPSPSHQFRCSEMGGKVQLHHCWLQFFLLQTNSGGAEIVSFRFSTKCVFFDRLSRHKQKTLDPKDHWTLKTGYFEHPTPASYRFIHPSIGGSLGSLGDTNFSIGRRKKRDERQIHGGRELENNLFQQSFFSWTTC